MPSLSRSAGTRLSTQLTAAISVGEIANPARKRNTPSGQRLSTNGSGAISSASASIPSR